MQKLTALVTGATSGIGLAFAKVCAGHGYDLVLIARNEEALKETALELENEHKVTVTVLPKDLSNPTAPDDIFKALQEKKISIDILINNAGIGLYDDFLHTDRDKEKMMISLNVMTTTQMMKVFLPGMVKRKTGRILNVASTSAYQPGPHMAVYYATKAFILSLSEAVAEEIRKTGVTITALCPGPTKTAFEKTSDIGKAKLFKLVKQFDADTVARIGYDGMMKGKRVIIPGIENKILAFGARKFPENIVTKLSRFTLE